MQRTVNDALGRTVTYTYPPKRIVSLCPGITDTLFALELHDHIVGRTRFCIHPNPDVLKVPSVAGTKDLQLERILALNPDIVIAEKEENTKEMVETLEPHIPVFVAEVQSVESAYEMMSSIGDLTDRKEQSVQLISEIQNSFSSMTHLGKGKVLYMIWKKPYMAAGKTTYIDSLLQQLGFQNAAVSFTGRYPVLTDRDIQFANPSFILLASEPYPFKEKHIEEFNAIAPSAKVLPIDGEMFWYGPRMLEAVAYFKNISHYLTNDSMVQLPSNYSVIQI